MPFYTRPNFEDRQIVQYTGNTITLSGQTNISNLGQFVIQGPILDFTGTTSASTLYTIAGVSGYINYGNVSSFKIQPPSFIQSGTTGTTTVDVTGYILSSLDADGNIVWSQPVDINISGFTYNDANKLTILNNNGSEYSVYLNQFSGLTINGSVSATTYYGDGSNLTGLVSNDFYVTGGTYVGTTLTLERQNGSVVITGFTSVFTGNTSGDCITDLFVSNVNSCSPLHIQNISSGDVLIGENGGVNVGIGTSTPTAKLHINNVTTGNTILLEDFTNPDSTPFVIDNNGSVGIGTLTPNATLDIKSPNDFISSYGIRWFNSGSTRGLNIDNDGYLYLNGRQTINWANNNSFTALDIIAQTAQILNVQGLGSGTVCIGPGVADSNTKLHIKGVDSSTSNYGLKVQDSGGTDNLVVRNDGNVGIGTSVPLSKLHLNGDALIQGDVNILGNVNILGTATTINTETVQTRDNKILLNYSGTTLSAIGGGIEILSAKTDGNNVSLTTDIYGDWNSNTGLNITGRTNDSTSYGLNIQNSDGTSNFVVRNDGYVGIGTESPTQKLHVSGNTLLSDNVNGNLNVLVDNKQIGGVNTRSSVAQRVVAESGGTDFLVGGMYLSGYETDLSGFGFSDNGTGYLKNAFTMTLAGSYTYGSINIGTRGAPSMLRFFSGNQNFNSTSLRGSLDSNGNWGFGTNMTGQTSTVDIKGTNGYNQLRLRTTYTPSSSGDTNGNIGDVAWDNNYLYIKTVSGWGRTVLDYSF